MLKRYLVKKDTTFNFYQLYLIKSRHKLYFDLQFFKVQSYSYLLFLFNNVFFGFGFFSFFFVVVGNLYISVDGIRNTLHFGIVRIQIHTMILCTFLTIFFFLYFVSNKKPEEIKYLFINTIFKKDVFF